MTLSNGVSCLLIAGKYWQNVVITQPNSVSCLIAAGQAVESGDDYGYRKTLGWAL